MDIDISVLRLMEREKDLPFEVLASAIEDLAREGGPRGCTLQIGRRILEERQLSFTQLHCARRAVARHQRPRSSIPTSKDQTTQNTLRVSYRSERG